MMPSAAEHSRNGSEAGAEPLATRLARRLVRRRQQIDRHLRLTDAHRFEDRGSAGCRGTLVVLLCSPARRQLQRHALEAFIHAARGQHVCVASPGRFEAGMSALTSRLGWSYLATSTPDDSLAQNVCYHLHGEARTIVKVEDAMLLEPDSIGRLAARFEALLQNGDVKPSALAPLMPQCLDQASQMPPLSLLQARLPRQSEELQVAPPQLDPGVLAFERASWVAMGHFPVRRLQLCVGRGPSGSEIEALRSHAARTSRPILVTSTVIACRLPDAAADGRNGHD